MRPRSPLLLSACTLSLSIVPSLAWGPGVAQAAAPTDDDDDERASPGEGDGASEGEEEDDDASPPTDPAAGPGGTTRGARIGSHARGSAGRGSIGGALRSEAPPTSPGAAAGGEPTKRIEDLDMRVTGSVSFGAKMQSWPNAQGTGIEGFSGTFERVALGFDGHYRGFVVAADYRFYGKYGTLHHAYIGYKHKEVFELDAGVHRVPFGILPYASHNWFETIPYYLGLADDYDFGLKGIVKKGGLDLQFAYYIQAEPAQFGQTQNSARYSYDLVRTDSSEISGLGQLPQSNEERHTGVARIAYSWAHRGEDSTEIGASAQFGGIYNRAIERYGSRWAAAVHYNGWYRRFNLQFEGLYYQFRPQNPGGQPRTWVTMGAWDAPYRVAGEGFVGVANLGYRLPLRIKAIDWIMFYNDHSILLKPTAGFDRTHMNVTGILLANRFVYIYLDTATGRNHPWFSPDYANALAEGEQDPHWWVWLNLSVGFYM